MPDYPVDADSALGLQAEDLTEFPSGRLATVIVLRLSCRNRNPSVALGSPDRRKESANLCSGDVTTLSSINDHDRLRRGISRRVSIDGRLAFAGGIGRVIGRVVEGNVRMVRSRGRIGVSAAHGKRTTSFSADRAG